MLYQVGMRCQLRHPRQVLALLLAKLETFDANTHHAARARRGTIPGTPEPKRPDEPVKEERIQLGWDLISTGRSTADFEPGVSSLYCQVPSYMALYHDNSMVTKRPFRRDMPSYMTLCPALLRKQPRVRFRQTDSDRTCTCLPMNDLRLIEPVVQRLVTVPVNDNEFATLVSFAFNVGTGNLEQSTLLKLLNLGWYEQVPDQLMRCNRSGGEVLGSLSRRRAAECQLWNATISV
jgi:lysozyme